MGFEETGNVLRALFAGAWTTTRVAWPGRSFSPPRQSGDPSSPNGWARYREIPTSSAQSTMSTSGVRDQHGMVVIDLFIEAAGSVDTLRQWADSVAAIFRDYDNSDIWCGEPSEQVNDQEKDEWIMWSVHVPYVKFETY